MPHRHRILPGSPDRLGARYDGSGTNFALFSANAEKVELCLFDPTGRRETDRIELPEYTHQVFHAYLPEVRPGQLYGYRVHGPYEPSAGHRFNPHKLLLDPYALLLKGPLRWHPALFGYRQGSRREDLSFDRRDSAFVMPKCVVVDPAHTWGDDATPRVPWDRTVIYEGHVKGMTARNEKLPPQLRGTFEGLGHPGTIDHLVKIGVTALELLPIHAFYDDQFLTERGLTNYWGYSTLGFFAPAPRYLSPDGGTHEFKTMVKRLHDAGIEVILDVVYNHTAEGNQMGPTLSFKGIDNASYYMLADDPRYYFDTTGTGNSLDLGQRRVLQMVMDSLRYWVEECHVDGFRFDLASTLGRERETFNPHAPFLEAVAQDPTLSGVKMIAEPWDTGPDGYQVGSFPPGWAEWNDRYRDTVRAYWRGDPGQTAEMAAKVLGSAPTYEHSGRKPWASINFLTAHDGFTLRDLVSFNHKHNEANGEDNRDGHSHNVSWNHGVEGKTSDQGILDLRLRQRMNMLATLMVSQGTPMILMGDERGRSQFGNNNAYCQDVFWNHLDWAKPEDPREARLERFTAGLSALRASRKLLRMPNFLHGESPKHRPGRARWLRPDGEPMSDGDWHDSGRRAVALRLDDGEPAILVLMNAGEPVIEFAVPKGSWRVLVDTEKGYADPASTVEHEGGRPFTVVGRALAVLEEA